MKIALFTTGIYPHVVGGMQKHSYYLAKYLAKNGVYVDLYHFVPADQTLVTLLEGFTDSELQYIRHFCFHFEKPARYPGHYIIESFKSSIKLYNAFRENPEVDFVYAQGFSGWYYAKQKSQGIKLPPVGVNFHGLNMFQKAALFRLKLEQLMFRRPVNKVIKLSDYTFSLGGKLTEILHRIVHNPNKILITPIGISETWLLDEPLLMEHLNRIKKFVFLGRYERGKGIEELSEVLRDISGSYAFEFHFIGPIPEDKHIKDNQIIYHGLIREEDKIKAILRESDVLVVPSYSEGMPTVILEAMASGCAIIATDVGAVCEEVDETNGWLIAPGDIASLKRAMIDAIEFPEETLVGKKKLSIQKIKDHFLWDRVIKKTMHQLNQVVNRVGHS